MAHKELFFKFLLLKKLYSHWLHVPEDSVSDGCTQNLILTDFFWPQLSIKAVEILKQYHNSNVHISHFTGFEADL